MRHFLSIAAIVALDQAVKHIVWRTMLLGQAITTRAPFFQLRYIRNEGAAWGVLQGQRWPLIILSFAMLIALYKQRALLLEMGRAGAFALSLLAGGIIGNLIDRVRLGYVIDYLDFFWKEWHFPAFNIADAAICLGAACFMALSFIVREHDPDFG